MSSPENTLRTRPPETSATGATAIASSLKHGVEQMGAVRTARTLGRMNQQGGFDCPSCAWPDPEHRKVAEFCESGAKAVAWEATQRTVGPAFFAEHSISELDQHSEWWLGQQGRLTHPMVRRDGADHYTPISWDDAFDLVAGHLRSLDDPDAAVFYTSGRTSNEAAFLYQAFVRAYGTNNLPDCSNMCHESSGAALTNTLGIGKGAVTLESLERSHLIIVMGQNPGTNAPRMLTHLETAKANGARVVAINPLPEAGLLRFKNPQTPHGLAGGGTAVADVFLQVRLGGDKALFQALGALLLEADDAAPGTVLDPDFITEHTAGFEGYAAHVRAVDWDAVLEQTGLQRTEIAELARLLTDSKATTICWAMGLTQHEDSVATIREVVNVLLLQGNIGKDGAGPFPIRGHSNVQGDRTMGITEKASDDLLDAVGTEFGFTPRREHGLDAVRVVQQLRDHQTRVLFSMGGNFAAATPDTAVVLDGLQHCDLTVQVSTKLNRSHTTTGRNALILPVLGRTDQDTTAHGRQFVTIEDSQGQIRSSRGRLAPPSDELISEVALVCRLAERVLADRPGLTSPWARFAADYDAVRDAISRTIPGFEDFNARIRQRDGFLLPHPPRDERRFTTPNGKANFTTSDLAPLRLEPGRLLLQTIRSHDQFNTTIYGLDDRYRGIKNGRRVVFLHPDDIAGLGLAEGQLVDIISEWDDDVERTAPRFRVVSYDTPRGCTGAYYPETNALVPLSSKAVGSNQPAFKSVVVRLVPSAEGTGHSREQSESTGGALMGRGDEQKRAVQPHHLS